MNVNKKILLEGKPIDLRLDGSGPVATSFAKLNVDSVKERENIIYRSWNIQFAQNTAAEEIDNAGHDEVQIMFNLNQDIDWFVKDKTKKATFGLEGKKIQMARGEVCVFRNNDYSTAMQYQAGVNFKFKSMQMPTPFFRNLLSRYFGATEIARMEERFLTSVVKTAITPEMLRVLSEIDTSERFKEYEGVYVEGKMIELTALVLYGIAYNKTDEIKRLPSPSKEDAERVESLREKIQRTPALEYDAPTVAQELGMSVSVAARLRPRQALGMRRPSFKGRRHGDFGSRAKIGLHKHEPFFKSLPKKIRNASKKIFQKLKKKAAPRPPVFLS